MLSRVKGRAKKLIAPFAEAFVRVGVRPNILTLIGFLFSVLSAVFFTVRMGLVGGGTLLIAGLFDMMDGAVARAGGMETKFGGVLDSTMDRCSDFLVLAAIAYGWRNETLLLPVWLWGAVALLGSFLVSYIRARAEAAGAAGMDVGIAERAERLLILSIGGLLGLLAVAVVVVAFLSLITAGMRLEAARRKLS